MEKIPSTGSVLAMLMFFCGWGMVNVKRERRARKTDAGDPKVSRQLSKVYCVALKWEYVEQWECENARVGIYPPKYTHWHTRDLSC